MCIIKAAMLSAAIGVGSLVPFGASAGIIFDQGVPLTISSFGFASDPDLPNQLADDFQFEGARTITDVHWWGVYSNNFNPPIDNFAIRIFADFDGAPGVNPLYEFVILGADAGRGDTGINNATGRDIYAYSADITPLLLAGSTPYWLSIVNNAADFPDRWFWMFSDHGNAVDRPIDGQAWGGTLISGENTDTTADDHPNGITLGFQLIAVPEPSTWPLFAAGLLGLSWVNSRRKA